MGVGVPTVGYNDCSSGVHIRGVLVIKPRLVYPGLPRERCEMVLLHGACLGLKGSELPLYCCFVVIHRASGALGGMTGLPLGTAAYTAGRLFLITPQVHTCTTDGYVPFWVWLRVHDTRIA